MWSYYGSKSKVINNYPPPKFDKIIEPFAGTARYALKYFEKEVLLVEKYDVIVRLWKWLQMCSPKDILSLPGFKKGDDIRKFSLTEEERFLMGFCIGRGNMMLVHLGGNFQNWSANKIRISKSLFKIKHWEIKLDTYLNIENEKATWFIDPPYQHGGHKYKESNKNIDFSDLAMWCQARSGQSIVCENTKANWLPFKPMISMNGAMFKTTEAIWSNQKTAFDNEQLNMF